MVRIWQIIEDATRVAGRGLGDAEVVTAVKARIDDLTDGYVVPDGWRVGGVLFVDDGVKRIQSSLAAYQVESIKVTGRVVRYGAQGRTIRVAVKFSGADELVGASILID